MKLKIHHPRVLLVLLMMAIIATPLLGCEPPSATQEVSLQATPTIRPTLPMPTMAPYQKEAAAETVRYFGVVERINGDQDWDTGLIERTDLAGALGVPLQVMWSDPVDSSGPWFLIHCKGRRKSLSTESWTGITMMEVTVDMFDASVAGYRALDGIKVSPSVGGSDSPQLPAVIWDVETGTILFENILGILPSDEEVCPPGMTDRNRRQYP